MSTPREQRCSLRRSSKGKSNGAPWPPVVNGPRTSFEARALKTCSARQAAEEIDHRGVDLAWALLLCPVAAAGEHLDVTQCGDEVLEVGQKLVHAGEGDHQ